MEINQNLKLIREHLHLSQAELANAIGVANTAISKYERDEVRPSSEFLSKLCSIYGINLNWLLSNIGDMFLNDELSATNRVQNIALYSKKTALNSEKTSDNPLLRSTKVDINIDDYIVVPLYDVYFSAGGGSFLEEEAIVDYLLFNLSLLKEHPSISKNLAGVRVKGDSMYPTLDNEDVVVIDMNTPMKNIYGGLFAINLDGKAYTKRLLLNPKNCQEVFVISDNKEHYPQITVNLSELNIIGQIVWHGKFLL